MILRLSDRKMGTKSVRLSGKCSQTVLHRPPAQTVTRCPFFPSASVYVCSFTVYNCVFICNCMCPVWARCPENLGSKQSAFLSSFRLCPSVTKHPSDVCYLHNLLLDMVSKAFNRITVSKRLGANLVLIFIDCLLSLPKIMLSKL